MGKHENLQALLQRASELKAVDGSYSDAQIREITAIDGEVKSLRSEIGKDDAARAAVKAISGGGDDEESVDGGPGGASFGKSGTTLFGPDAPRLKMTDQVMGRMGASLAAKAFQYSRRVGQKAGLSVTGAVSEQFTDGSGNVAIAQQGAPPNTLLEMLPLAQVATGHVEYLRQGPRSSAATVVAPGEVKPTTNMELELIRTNLKVVAHISKADKFLLQDIGSAGAFFANELALGVRDALENRVLNGAGGESDITGIMTTTGVKAQVFATDVLTTIRQGLLKLELGGYIPSMIVLNPSDWADLELQRNTSGQFDLKPGETPINSIERRLWGAQVVCSRFLTAGQAVIIGDNTVGIFMDRQTGIETKWAEEAAEAFERNQIIGRAEGRFELAAHRPDGVVVADLTAA